MGKWSIRKRKGFDTPSLEEFFWFHLLPGGIYKTATAEGGLESEEFDYYLGSGLIWFGSMAYAVNAMEAASALGTTNVAAEFAVYRNLKYIQTVGRVFPATASAVAWAATGELHGAVPPGTGMGMPMTPDLYSGGTSSNPAGWDFSSWWSNLW